MHNAGPEFYYNPVLHLITPCNDPTKLACFQNFIDKPDKHNKTSLLTEESTEPDHNQELWSKIEKLNQKFLDDLKLLLA